MNKMRALLRVCCIAAGILSMLAFLSLLGGLFPSNHYKFTDFLYIILALFVPSVLLSAAYSCLLVPVRKVTNYVFMWALALPFYVPFIVTSIETRFITQTRFYESLINRLKSKKDIITLISILRNENWKIKGSASDLLQGIRLCAAFALGELGDPRAVEMLAEILLNDYYLLHEVAKKATAAKSRGIECDDYWIGQLVQSIEKEYRNMRNLYENSSVFYGIEDIQLKKRLIIAFYVWLRNKDLHLRAAEALGCIGSPQAVELLIIALKDWDEGVRRCVVEALDKIGDPRALEPLRVALEDDDSSVRYRVAAALKKMEATPRQQQPDVENKNIRRTDMLDIDSERLITTMTDSMEETNVRLAAVMKVTQEAVATEAAKGSDARARLAGTLFVAAVNGDLRVATRCLDLGIDPNWPRRNGTDVLRDIVGMGDARLEITKILISRGADPNVGTIPVLRQIQGSAFCDNEKTIAFLRAIKARE